MFQDSVHKFLHISMTALLVFAFAFGASGVQVAHAAGIVVNSNVDDTLANLDANTTCDLREAISNANDDAATYTDCGAGSGADTITFNANYTITLVDQMPAVTTALTITGNGAANTILQANAAPNTTNYRVFEVSSTGNLNLDALTVRNAGRTGFFKLGAGISNLGTLTVTNSTFSSNGGDAFGGGIYNAIDAMLTVTNSTFSGNSVSGAGGGIGNQGTLTVTGSTFSGNSTLAGGGGIRNDGTAIVTDSTFSGNSAIDGGGISNSGTLTVTGSTFSGNSVSGAGGGILGSGQVTVTNSTFSENSSRWGGAVFIDSAQTLIDSTTFSNNTAVNLGGGVYNEFDATLDISNSTFSGNNADEGGGLYGYEASTVTVTNSTFSGNGANVGGGINNNGTATLKNTLVANSTSGGNCSGTIGDGGGNLSWTDTTCPGINADPMLLALADNGGPTQTMALDSGSAAIDAAVNVNCPATDQRGVERPQGPQCDIGAYELEATLFNFSGFFSPVDNPPIVNTVKAGAGVPVKFSLNGDQGLDILAAGSPKSQPISCSNGAPTDSIEETVTSGNNSLQYDPVTDTYTYVWKTQKAWKNTCRQFILTLNDDSEHVANFQFK